MDLKIIYIFSFTFSIIIFFGQHKTEDTDNILIYRDKWMGKGTCECSLSLLYFFITDYPKGQCKLCHKIKPLLLPPDPYIRFYDIRNINFETNEKSGSERIYEVSTYTNANHKFFLIADFIINILTLWGLLLCGYLFHQNRKLKNLIKEKDEILELFKRKKTQYKKLYDQFLNKEVVMRKEHTRKIDRCNVEIKKLKNENKELKKNLATFCKVSAEEYYPDIEEYILALRLIFLKKKDKLKRSFTAEEEIIIYNLVDILYGGFNGRLIKRFPGLKKQNIELCNFLKLGYNNIELSYLFNNKPDSVRKYKKRLEKELNIPHGIKLDDFIRQF